jgi:hypothetical protein
MGRLAKLAGVTVIPRDEKLKYRHAHSRIWNETWLSAFFHKPCNHELFVLQSLNMEGKLGMAYPLSPCGVLLLAMDAVICSWY